MIYINPNSISIPDSWRQNAANLKAQLLALPDDERNSFINANRNETWGHADVLSGLRNVAGNKCWYSEVDLTGADPNVDHFRPKGRVREIDPDTFISSGQDSDGYWWLAFDAENFRLSSMHSNQRRVDLNTNGGKWDYFPVDGVRAQPTIALNLINEAVLPFDPCSQTDVALMWFGPDGKPGFSNWRRSPSSHEIKRMKVTIWLFHLDKNETAIRRTNAVEEIKIALKNADAIYQIWQMKGGGQGEYEKVLLDSALAAISNKISDKAEFAGAKRSAVQIARSEFLWMEELFPRTF